MSVTISAKPAILLLTGASGAGKTTLLHELEALAMTGVECINCDRVKVEGHLFSKRSQTRSRRRTIHH